MKNFNELLEINKKYFPDADNVRIDNLDEVYSKLDEFYSKEFNLDDFIKLCIQLFNMQIFFDGNSRTILTYLNMVIENNGYSFDIDKATNGLIKLKGLFPVMYDLSDELDYKDIEKIKKFIYIKENSKGRK